MKFIHFIVFNRKTFWLFLWGERRAAGELSISARQRQRRRRRRMALIEIKMESTIRMRKVGETTHWSIGGLAFMNMVISNNAHHKWSIYKIKLRSSDSERDDFFELLVAACVEKCSGRKQNVVARPLSDSIHEAKHVASTNLLCTRQAKEK